MIQLAARDHQADIRELVVQSQTLDAAHDSLIRPTPDELASVYAIDKQCALPVPTAILLFDDVLTTGCHFKAMKRVLNLRYPGVSVIGLFIARRAPDTTPIEDLADS